MSRRSDPCYMGQHDRCKSPFCRCDCGCQKRVSPVVERDSRSEVWENRGGPDSHNGDQPPVTKRTRFEVLKRDNHTCRYCGGSVPDVVLTVDHVTPVALGGSDDPSNLVVSSERWVVRAGDSGVSAPFAACKDCNAGKASTSPGAPLVEDVKASDLRWSGAIKRVATARARQRRKEDKYACAFYDYWRLWTNSRGELAPMPNDWELGIRRFYDLGLTIEDLMRCVDIAMGNKKIYRDDMYRYFAGCAWRTVTESQDAAKALLDAEALDGS